MNNEIKPWKQRLPVRGYSLQEMAEAVAGEIGELRAHIESLAADAAVSGDREKFEAWAKDKAYGLLLGSDQEKYLSGYTQGAWEIWQAAIAHQPPKEALTEKAIGEMWKTSCNDGGDTTQALVIHFARAIEAASAPNKQLVEALQKINRIEDKLHGSDWQEIEEAREIARAALTKGQK